MTRFDAIPAGHWTYLSPAFQGLSDDLKTVEAAVADSGLGGSATLPANTLVGVAQASDGTWELTPAQVTNLRPCKVMWFENATANDPLTAADGALNGDFINGAPVPAGTFPTPPTEPTVTYVTITAPVAVEADGTASDFVRLTKTEGVIWTVAGAEHAPSSFATATKDVPTGGSTSVSVTATPMSGYAIVQGHVTSWTLTFSALAAPTVLWSDDFGTSALTESAFLSRKTPVGDSTVSKIGNGSVTVNAAGQLVIDAAAGATTLTWSDTSTYGRMTYDVVSVTGIASDWSNRVSLEMLGGTDGTYALARFYGGWYMSFTAVSYTEKASGSNTRAALPSKWVVTFSETGGVTTMSAKDGANGESKVTHTGTIPVGSRKGAIFVPVGAVVTLAAVKKEAI